MSDERRAMPEGYVARIRFAWESELEAKLAKFPWPKDTTPVGWPEPAVALTPTLAPRTLALAEEVAIRLRLIEPFGVVQTMSVKPNGQAGLRATPFMIRLIGPVATLLDDGALRALLGHEIGHRLAHGGGRLVARHNDIAARAPMLASRCSVAMELTADRFALLACQDLDAAVRLEITSVLGERAQSLGVDERRHLETCIRGIEDGKVAVVAEGGTHPTKEFRLYASWLFHQTDVYRELTGNGPAKRTLVEVDDRLRTLCRSDSHEMRPPEREEKAKDNAAAEHVTPLNLAKAASARGARAVGAAVDAVTRNQPGWLARARVLLAGRVDDVGAPEDAPVDLSVLDEPDELAARFEALEARERKPKGG